VISYNYGAANKKRLKKIHKISIKLIFTASAGLTVICYIFAPVMVRFFAGSNHGVYEMALHGFRIFATSCLLTGINVYASALFTALNDGKTSAILSFCRTVVFLVIPVIVLPVIAGIDGVWAAIPVGEVLSILMSVYYFRKLHFR
jgi:Na+-driven multidrug efflux pump